VSRVAFFAVLAGVSATAFTHHGPSVEPLYDTSGLVELDGVVTEVFWRNPHVRFRIDVAASGAEAV